MGSRWEDEDEELGRGRDRLRGREPEPEPTLGEVIEGSVRKLVTGLVIAGGLIGLGVYGGGRGGGGDPSVDYQITSTPDGTIYRLDSENGRIVACRENRCWRLLYDRDEIQKAPPAVTQQQGPPQLPAPQNQQAPAQR